MISPVREFYKGKSIFITGGTGLLGVLTIEKLLRCCEIKEIYVLIRGKKKETWQERLQKFCEDKVFNRVKELQPDFHKKIIGINGDCGFLGLGISAEDRQRLCRDVNIVFHSGALVNMDADLKDAINVNADGTQRLIDLCHEMEQLQAFLYVSTWYSNVNQAQIDEKFYDPEYSLEQLKQLNEQQQAEVFKKSQLVNSYCFSKNLSENVIQLKASDLPAVIFRPPIVLPTREDPFPGWTNNFWGAIGITTLTSLGIWKILGADPELQTPYCPADMCVNEMLASAWDTAVRKPDTIPIYNCLGDKDHYLTMKAYSAINVASMQKIPPMKAVLPIGKFKIVKNRYWLKVQWFFHHTLPAIFIDFVQVLKGQKPELRRTYKKLDKLQNTFHHFLNNAPRWTNDNTKALWDRMTPEDKQWLNFDMSTLDWHQYIYSSVEGIRTYLLKDDPSTIPEARKRQAKFKANMILSWF